MKRIRLILAFSFFVYLAPSYGQVIGFNTSEKADIVNSSDLRTYFQMTAMVFGSSRLNPFVPTGNKGSAGLSAQFPINFSNSVISDDNRGIAPIFFLNFKISDNLFLSGSMTSLNNGQNIAQVISYGINVILGDLGPGSQGVQWKRTTVSGLRDFRVTMTDFMYNRSFNSLWGLKAGVGTTLFKINMFAPLEQFMLNNYESSRGYILAGYEFSLKEITLFPMVRINSDHVQVGIDISLGY